MSQSLPSLRDRARVECMAVCGLCGRCSGQVHVRGKKGRPCKTAVGVGNAYESGGDKWTVVGLWCSSVETGRGCGRAGIQKGGDIREQVQDSGTMWGPVKL